ncbi:MAG: hypothetical protein R6V29_14910 [Spirochaetia bacterium]
MESADATTRPTEMTASSDNLQEALGPDGSWIILFEDDLTVGEEVVVSGEVYEEEGAEEPRRKLALYAQDSDRNVTDRYTLTTPRMVVQHMNTRIQSGTVSGNVYVEAEGFELVNGATINGNLYFADEELRDSANIDDSSEVIGSTEIMETADATSRPTEMTATDADNLQQAVGAEGSWIVLFEEDVSVDERVEIVGAVYEEEGAEEPRRKLALYAQDSDRNVTDRYTLSVPELVVYHMNTRVQSGTIAGDVYVESEGFELVNGATIEGDLYFASEELQESANIDDDSSVSGETSIGTIDD